MIFALVTKTFYKITEQLFISLIALLGYSALHSLEEGFRTVVIDDCSRGITLDGMEKMKEDLTANGGLLVQSSEIKPMLDGSDRRPELAYKLAMNLKNTADVE